MQKFRKLKVWQQAHSLALRTYEATKGFPREEVFGLTTQIRRSAVSIPANLAGKAAAELVIGTSPGSSWLRGGLPVSLSTIFSSHTI